MPTTYPEADALLTGRNKDRRKLANNTYLERRHNGIAVRLHNTDVVTYQPDGTIVLDSGGWLTPTTKDRINNYSPVTISQTQGEWFVHRYGEWDHPFCYEDGFTIHPDGTVSGEPDDIGARRERNRIMRRDIKKFVDSITPEQIVHAIENPGGDCLICRMPDIPGHEDHIAMHVEENYFHAHLLLRALESRGFRDPDVIMGMIYYDAQRGVVSRDVKQTLPKYLRKKMLEGVATK